MCLSRVQALSLQLDGNSDALMLESAAPACLLLKDTSPTTCHPQNSVSFAYTPLNSDCAAERCAFK